MGLSISIIKRMSDLIDEGRMIEKEIEVISKALEYRSKSGINYIVEFSEHEEEKEGPIISMLDMSDTIRPVAGFNPYSDITKMIDESIGDSWKHQKEKEDKLTEFKFLCKGSEMMVAIGALLRYKKARLKEVEKELEHTKNFFKKEC